MTKPSNCVCVCVSMCGFKTKIDLIFWVSAIHGGEIGRVRCIQIEIQVKPVFWGILHVITEFCDFPFYLIED